MEDPRRFPNPAEPRDPADPPTPADDPADGLPLFDRQLRIQSLAERLRDLAQISTSGASPPGARSRMSSSSLFCGTSDGTSRTPGR